MLTDTHIRKIKSTDKPFKLADSGGLYVFVTPAGGRLWRLKYRHGGKEKTLSIGPYPDVGLAEARTARDNAKKVLREGRDPSVVRQIERVERTENTFENIAREWHEMQKPSWIGKHVDDVIDSLEKHVFPELGKVPIKDITVPDVLRVLRVIEQRPAIETARRVRQRMSAVFCYAISAGRGDDDPAATVLKALAPRKRGKQPAVGNIIEAKKVLRDAEATPAHLETKLGLRFIALTVVRPGELRHAGWGEFEGLDTAEPLWRIPADRMKMKREHIVPLSTQAVEVLETMRSITGKSPFVFPSPRHPRKPMSENAMGYLLNRAGYHSRHVPHGWRSTFSTVMNEQYPMEGRIIDMMLAHVSKDKVEGAYNRSQYLTRRRQLAQIWADQLIDGQQSLEALLKGPRK